ncbi:RNA polymerase sigma factor [Peptoniphilus stercorisuis]|uniref:RNA polymerase sigma-70 factor (ECF subfamily) n=1 Tax=Peptoniphilus stercorisuis TaxID=1436965 RepID=A0ABS4KD96_9FIRM|nr:RNA polymerase sigma factor [Peptoniphilus stercorisuis]MBP2025743.1 RNA polymerase sigma-70 factor (ECF subfamily) [Peptoniphilus stercorisuis]
MEFEEIYNLYFKEIYLYIKSLSKDENIAEEITQETFFKALKNIESFDGSKDIRAWLFTIAKNTYFSHYKKNKNLVYESFLEKKSIDIKFIDKLINEEDAFLIHQFIHKMKEPYKEVFYLRVFGELNFKSISEIFGKSESWARVTFYRAKGKIREYLEEIE